MVRAPAASRLTPRYDLWRSKSNDGVARTPLRVLLVARISDDSYLGAPARSNQSRKTFGLTQCHIEEPAVSQIASHLRRELSWLTPRGHAIVGHLLEVGGYPGRAQAVASAVGLRNRFQLTRTLRQEGLPCLDELSGWIRTLRWVHERETERIAVSRSALEAGRDPALCYRTVVRVTGHHWREVREFGWGWVVTGLRARCPGVAGTADAAPTSDGAGSRLVRNSARSLRNDRSWRSALPAGGG